MEIGVNKCATIIVSSFTIRSRSKREFIFFNSGQQISTTDCYTYLDIRFVIYLFLDSVIKFQIKFMYFVFLDIKKLMIRFHFNILTKLYYISIRNNYLQILKILYFYITEIYSVYYE